MDMRRRSACRGIGLAAIVAVSILGPVGPAAAAASDVSPSGFVVTLRQEVQASPHRVYEALGEVDRWWSSQHTWSGHAANLSLATQASACFCERWEGNSVEHGRVVYAARDSVLRLQAALGPLQALAVNAVLTFAVAEKEGRTVLQVTYRVSGNDAAGLQELAGPVDGVLAGQVHRLAAHAEGDKLP
jgi:uncharacterized protein YndB with AHSA1/START domain